MTIHAAIAESLERHPAVPLDDDGGTWCECGEEWPCSWRVLLEAVDCLLPAFNEYGGHQDDCPASFLRDADCGCGYELARRRYFEVRERLEIVLGEAA